MRNGRWGALLGGLCVLVGGIVSGKAAAQASTFGTVSLAPGFMPDPHIVSGRSGGTNDARNVNPQCRGWIAGNPDHILQLSAPFSFLRIIAESSSDTTLFIQTPQGQVLCADDTYARNPSVEGSFQPGTYRVWVGSYRQNEVAQYSLGFTEMRSQTSLGAVAPSASPVGANPGLDISSSVANFMPPVVLNPGFTPDPQNRNGTSGGAVNVASVGSNCRGWATARPDHLLRLTRAFNYFRIEGTSSVDTTLIVYTPDGRWLCDDDSAGNRNPRVQQDTWLPGVYRVWVGSYAQGQDAAYNLAFSELQPDGVAMPTTPPPSQFGGNPGLHTAGSVANFMPPVALAAGFLPDPQNRNGRSGGALDASRLGNGCRGWVSPQPDHILNLAGPMQFFHVSGTSSVDTTLVVYTPDGRWLCDDDSAGNRNPRVQQAAWPPGMYRIWVGSYSQGQDAQYNLSFSERRY